jgi:hypothetical protein
VPWGKVPLMYATLDHPALRQQLAWLRRKRTAVPKASMTVFKGQAQITCGALEVSVPYVGDWQGVVTFDGDLLRASAKTPPAGDVIEIRYLEGRIWLGALSAAAVLG